VGGVEQLDRPAQQKIEAVASEIHRLTGLDVDIVVGSSPKRILVHVPEIGYVEEQWIQKNINTLIGQSIGRTNWFLLWLFSGVSVLFVLNTVLVSALQRQRAIGLLKALGWRSSTVFGTMLREILLAGGVGWLAGAILALGLAWLLRLQLLWEQVALSLPFALALCVMGGSLPIWVGIRRAPVTALQMGQVNVNRRLRIRGGYGFQSLLRRPARSLIVLLGQAAGSGLVVLIFLALYESQGYLMGTLTLLGEYIQQRIEGYHYLIAALCLGLSAMALSDQMILAVREQAAEVGLLIAVGWRRRQVFQMFISQGLALGMAGGIMGAVSAVVLFWVLSGSLPLNALWIGPLGAGVCVAVSGLAAWFPARQAAGLNPVEAIRSGE
jgi:predicted lysophospholipase L1 biosynthesis ABC-type transport system permease subunit